MKFVDIDVLAGETVIILARWYGQIVRIGETFHLADGDDAQSSGYGRTPFGMLPFGLR